MAFTEVHRAAGEGRAGEVDDAIGELSSLERDFARCEGSVPEGHATTGEAGMVEGDPAAAEGGTVEADGAAAEFGEPEIDAAAFGEVGQRMAPRGVRFGFRSAAVKLDAPARRPHGHHGADRTFIEANKQFIIPSPWSCC
ncbi:hypothetical protein [Streptomyces sp. MA5143a]|uniref:hypothetical protein n=1 Tax=Streptomyces sp. MA5143a TaxID=2083010 RepID=UPI001C6323BA|nr:hypothetical protein [Streptomyces sp. MA5143a]